MNCRSLIVVTVLFFSSSCNAKNAGKIDNEVIQSVIKYYVTPPTYIKNDSYIQGDFNNDSFDDLAILYNPRQNISQNKKIKFSKPWLNAGANHQKKYRKSLLIINGMKEGFTTSKNSVFVLLNYSGALETPSFELIVKKRSEKDYSEYRAMLPNRLKGDIIVLPTEAGIDTYIYWSKDKYLLHIPEEVP